MKQKLVCLKCGDEKPVVDFYFCKKTKRWVMPCKACHKRKHRISYLKSVGKGGSIQYLDKYEEAKRILLHAILGVGELKEPDGTLVNSVEPWSNIVSTLLTNVPKGLKVHGFKVFQELRILKTSSFAPLFNSPDDMIAGIADVIIQNQQEAHHEQ